jgi:hypothetical protein
MVVTPVKVVGTVRVSVLVVVTVPGGGIFSNFVQNWFPAEEYLGNILLMTTISRREQMGSARFSRGANGIADTSRHWVSRVRSPPSTVTLDIDGSNIVD